MSAAKKVLRYLEDALTSSLHLNPHDSSLVGYTVLIILVRFPTGNRRIEAFFSFVVHQQFIQLRHPQPKLSILISLLDASNSCGQLNSSMNFKFASQRHSLSFAMVNSNHSSISTSSKFTSLVSLYSQFFRPSNSTLKSQTYCIE